MYRGLDLSDVPESKPNQQLDDDLHNIFQQRIEAEKTKENDRKNASAWKKRLSNPEDDAKHRQEARDKRDSWIFEDQSRSLKMKVEESGNYQTSGSNEKYVKYYDPSARDMEYNGPYKQPPHPRQRHRCDYHLEDVLQSLVDRKVPVWDATKVWMSCMLSDVGSEPERLRKEVWRW